MAKLGKIPADQLAMSKRPFLVMGILDAIASIMQIFAATYLPGSLITLLLQAAIPVSMIISKYLANAKYDLFQYFGAVIVVCGILTVLSPSLVDGGSSGSTLWACVLIASTIPMTLSSVYKELALGQTEIDPMYLNGWVAIFQFLFALVLCVPSSLASNPPVPIPDLPRNLLDGLYCYAGVNTITCSSTGTDDNNSNSNNGSNTCTPDDCFPDGPIFVNIYMFFNQLYNLLIILLLKYGSSNLLYLALTLMVPLANVTFTLPFMPDRSTLKLTDILGLVIICSGLACYRFAGELYRQYVYQRARGLSRNQRYSSVDRKYSINNNNNNNNTNMSANPTSLLGGRFASGGWFLGMSGGGKSSSANGRANVTVTTPNYDYMRQLLLEEEDDNDESSEIN